ncbi:MAG TPA: TonB-dependent receptor [Povalibacter sp.]|nr:TonB-dependent receptor [Povalibacter sp.]
MNAAESGEALEEVIVTGIRASFTDAIQVKRESDHIVEAISADNMGQLPNVTVAESLVRLPGINGARDRGNESLATVRGLGPRLTMGTVNGREIASSEPNRNVRWEVFPTEIVSTVKVFKSQSADLISGGVAGTIDIGTIRPLSYGGPQFVTSAGAVYYDEGTSIPGYDPLGGRVGASWVGKVNDDLGFALGATYQTQKNAYPSMGSWGYTDSTNAQDVNGDGVVDPTPWGAATEVKQLEQDRQGVMGAMQWRVGNMEMNLDALYSKITIDEKQNQTWFQGMDYSIWSSGNKYTTPGSSYTMIDGDVVAGTMANSYNRMDHVVGQYSEDKTLAAAGLNAAWSGDVWSFVTDLSYSDAKRDNTWQAVDLVSFPATTSYDWRNSITPTISVSSDALDAVPAPTWNGSAGQSAGPENLRDKIGAIAATLTRTVEWGAFNAIDVGGRYADREKSHEYFSWNQPGSGAPLSAYDGLLPRFTIPDLTVPSALNGNLSDLAEIAFGGFNPSLAREDILQHWKVKEETTEGYLRAVFDSQAYGIGIRGNVGARVVHVKTTSTGYDQINGVNTPATDGHSYTDVLPSATVNFIFDAEHILRLSAAKVLARPPLDELRTGRSLADPVSTVGQLTGSGANPQLDPFRANQFDVSYEWYFHKESMLAMALFTKSVESTIGYKQGHEVINGYDYLISGPFNGGGGYIDGIELTFQTPFYFWGLDNFGVYSNYAFVDSNLKEFSPANDPVPLSGLAKNTGALDLWYNNGPVEVRLGYKFHSPYTIIYGWNSQAISRLGTENILDLSASWQMSDIFGVRFQVGNLTNEPLRAYFDNQINRLANKDGSGGFQVYGRRYMLELTAKF